MAAFSSKPSRSGIWTVIRATALVILALSCSAPACADVKVHGATTVTFGLMRPHQAEIERLAGVHLIILPSSTSHGLTDLVQAKADIAMLAEPLEAIAGILNKKQPGFVNLAEYAGRHVGNAFVQIIVHPSNTVKALTNDQLAGLFSGRIKNWSEIGGAHQPVLAVGEPTSSPHRMIQEALKIAYAPDLRVVQNANQTAIVVAQAPGAISYITTAHDLPIRDKLSVVNSELKLPLQLYLAFRKDAPEHVKRVIDAAASVGAR
jgi:phosphate transport system substrate-binding protein